MKIYKNIIFTTIVLSMITLFSATLVNAHEFSRDYYAGKKLGHTQVKADANYGNCGLGQWSAERSAKKASVKHVEKKEKENRSMDFISGFRNGYGKSWQMPLDLICTR